MSRLLSGPELWELHKGITAAFDDKNSLAQMLLFRLDEKLSDYSTADKFPDVVFALVQGANSRGWWRELLIAARSSNPKNPALIEAEASLLASAPLPEDQGNLEKIVDLRSVFQDVDAFGKRHGQLVNAVCAIEDALGGIGTGCLVGPRHVMTNYHVVKRLIDGGSGPGDLRCRFDFKIIDGIKEPGRAIALNQKWCMAHRPFSKSDVSAGGVVWHPDELDYAVLRLSEPVGTQPVGTKPEPGAPARGWLQVSPPLAEIVNEGKIYIYQHPQDLSNPLERRLLPMKLSTGEIVDQVGDGMRLRHNATTLPGSSGSMCCNGELEVIGLHHAGDPQDWPAYRGRYNQAIPMHRILEDLKARVASGSTEIEPFWETLQSH